MELPGYRFDAGTNRYYKLDARFDRQPDPAPPSPVLNKRPRTVETVFPRLQLAEVNAARYLANLVVVDEQVFGTSKNNLMRFAARGDEEWAKLKLHAGNLNASNQLDSGECSLLEPCLESKQVVHYSPASGEVSVIADMQVQHRVPLSRRMTCLAVCGADRIVLLGKGANGVQLGGGGGELALTFPSKTKSDALCVQAKQSSVMLVGLRQGSAAVWDTRANTQSTFLASSGPVLKLWENSQIEHLITCFAPNGNVCDASLHLLDLRFAKPLASYDLHCAMTSPIPLVSNNLLFGLDSRTHQYRVFDMDTARFHSQLAVDMPPNTACHALVAHSPRQVDIVASSRSHGIVRLQTT